MPAVARPPTMAGRLHGQSLFWIQFPVPRATQLQSSSEMIVGVSRPCEQALSCRVLLQTPSVDAPCVWRHGEQQGVYQVVLVAPLEGVQKVGVRRLEYMGAVCAEHYGTGAGNRCEAQPQ